MKTLLIAASALTLATPALAQMTTGAVEGQTTTTQTAPVNPEATAPAPTTATPVAPSTPQAQEQLIASEFPTYDKDGSGALSPAEFGAWMTALKEKSGGPKLAAAEAKTWVAGAFATADKDKSKAVTLAELTTYLTQGA